MIPNTIIQDQIDANHIRLMNEYPFCIAFRSLFRKMTLDYNDNIEYKQIIKNIITRLQVLDIRSDDYTIITTPFGTSFYSKIDFIKRDPEFITELILKYG